MASPLVRILVVSLALGLAGAPPAFAADSKTAQEKAQEKGKATAAAKKTPAKTAAKPAGKSTAKTTVKNLAKNTKTKTAAKPAPKPPAAKTASSHTTILTNPGSSAAYDDYVPPPSTGAIGDRSILAQAYVALDRGQASAALNVAGRIHDGVMADAVRGEAYANGAPASAADIFAFLSKYPAFPQRNAIAAAAEGQLSAESVYEPMLDAYTVDAQPATSQGFNSWIATLRAHGRDALAKDAIRARWRTVKMSDGQEDDFRYRYAGVLTAEDTAARRGLADEDTSARWKDLHVRIRDDFSQRAWRDAYDLASRHNLDAGSSDYANAEFICGWLALRHLGQPKVALAHFKHLYESVKTPISKSRGAYWIGRTYEALGDKASAREWYETGSAYPTFFYGQLSVAKLYPGDGLRLPEPEVSASARAAFERGALPHIVRSLNAIGEQDRAARFLKTLANSNDSREDFILTDDLARSLGKPNLEVSVTKVANQKGFTLGSRGFPVTAMAKGSNPETALALGIIRQESEFRADAKSQAGALGMMQLMPSTARGLANRAGIGFSDNDLLRPDYNVKLGREYLGDRLDEFSGSYILAIASYNAGHGRVREWLDIYGDPRSPSVDPIDWIETLPVYETRNYVQRVLENTQVYRAKLAQGKVPLQIVSDLTR